MCSPWRRRKRDLYTPYHNSDVNFTIENPAHGKIWSLKCVQTAIAQECMQMAQTSYCKYGAEYSKPTGIAHTLGFDLNLFPTCSKQHPCVHRMNTGRHPTSIVEVVDKAARNSLPQTLVQVLLTACESKARKNDALAILFVDVFAGWGSVCNVVESSATMPLFVYTNDIARKRHCHLDVDVDRFGLDFVVRMAMIKMFERMANHPQEAVRNAMHTDGVACSGAEPFEPLDLLHELKRRRIHLWVHMSVPCTTYSTMGGGTHRAGGSNEPMSPLAQKHDHMLEHILEQVCEWRRILREKQNSILTPQHDYTRTT